MESWDVPYQSTTNVTATVSCLPPPALSLFFFGGGGEMQINSCNFFPHYISVHIIYLAITFDKCIKPPIKFTMSNKHTNDYIIQWWAGLYAMKRPGPHNPESHFVQQIDFALPMQQEQTYEPHIYSYQQEGNTYFTASPRLGIPSRYSANCIPISAVSWGS